VGGVQAPVKKRIWTGTAIGLALCTAALSACSQRGNSSNQASSNAAAPVEVQWNSNLEKQLREAIANAPANGLKPELFLKGDDHDGAVLTQAALKYAGALAHGYSDPTKIFPVYTIPRPSGDVRQGLMNAMHKGDVTGWLNSLPPQTDEYKALSQAHLKYLKLASSTNFQAVPDGAPMKPGSHDKRVPALAAALTAMGYLQAPQQQGAAPSRYSPQMVAAVKHLQSDFGMTTDGIVGGNTLSAVNLGPGGLARECAIAMERLRWLQRDPPPTRIDVNTAATILDYWRDGQHVDRREVVAGEPDKPTPQIQAPIVNLVAYPKWRVPDSILKDELASKSQAYLAENMMEYRDGRLVQLPGPKNSLGEVKFDMRNNEHIYLHDTPAKALFGVPERHRSHGCVRVQDALGFALLLAHDDGILVDFQEAMMKPDQEGYVKLKKEVPVRLMYRTTFVDDGQVKLVEDVYGWDDDVGYALGYVRRPPRAKQKQVGGDVGP